MSRIQSVFVPINKKTRSIVDIDQMSLDKTRLLVYMGLAGIMHIMICDAGIIKV